ncbi:MAG TPA: hypothetical protein VFY99_07560 [Solirubrobacterales bacterium]
MLRRKPRNPAQRLRTAVDAMPRRTRIAMLTGIDENRIVVGAYTDKESGGICPMLAAHRNGGRTSLASFARSWDRFTNARRPRLATEREVRTLRSYIEMSLLRDEQGTESVSALANEIRADRRAAAKRAAKDTDLAPEGQTPRGQTPKGQVATGERHRARELRHRRFWSWLRPTRSYDVFAENVAAATEQLNEQRAAAGSSGRDRETV